MNHSGILSDGIVHAEWLLNNCDVYTLSSNTLISLCCFYGYLRNNKKALQMIQILQGICEVPEIDTKHHIHPTFIYFYLLLN